MKEKNVLKQTNFELETQIKRRFHKKATPSEPLH